MNKRIKSLKYEIDTQTYSKTRKQTSKQVHEKLLARFIIQDINQVSSHVKYQIWDQIDQNV